MPNSTETSQPPPPPGTRPKIIVLGAGRKAGVVAGAEALRPVLEHHADIAVWDMDFSADLSRAEADWVVVFGGDGSILRAANQMGYRQRPILGVNLGKLGFLADLDPGELPAVLPLVVAGKLRVIDHLMFECSLLRGEQVVWTELGLNETAVLGGAPFVMLDVHLYVDAHWVTTYSCDGLIVSTPVGSTAHNLSAGGPILRQDLRAFCISPICPHTLTMRPVVDSADRVYELCVPGSNRAAHAVIDGRAKGPLEAGDRLRIRAAEPRFRLIEAPGHGYYETLRQKLGWSGRISAKKPPASEV